MTAVVTTLSFTVTLLFARRKPGGKETSIVSLCCKVIPSGISTSTVAIDTVSSDAVESRRVRRTFARSLWLLNIVIFLLWASIVVIFSACFRTKDISSEWPKIGVF